MYYHVSKIDRGEEFVFKPKLPESALISKEGDIPRICVCSNVYFCLRAITSSSSLSLDDLRCEFVSDNDMIPPAVYMTQESPYIPPDASDFRFNDERWFLSKIKMERVGYINLKPLFEKGAIELVKQKELIQQPLFYDKDRCIVFDKRKKITCLA